VATASEFQGVLTAEAFWHFVTIFVLTFHIFMVASYTIGDEVNWADSPKVS
jgi:hypothetical protein